MFKRLGELREKARPAGGGTRGQASNLVPSGDIGGWMTQAEDRLARAVLRCDDPCVTLVKARDRLVQPCRFLPGLRPRSGLAENMSPRRARRRRR